MLAEAAVWGFGDKFIPATITRGHFSTIINLDKDGPQEIFAIMATREPLRPSRRACKAMYSRYGDVSHRELLIWYNVFPCKWLSLFCLYQWSLATKCVLHLCACLSLSGSAWPRSEVMADAVSTSWVSFTSSSSIHPHYKHKPRVSAEPWKQTRQTTSSFLLVWLAKCKCREEVVYEFAKSVRTCVCVCVRRWCNIWSVMMHRACSWHSLKRIRENRVLYTRTFM